MTETLRIRPANVADAPAMAACVNAAYQHYVSRMGKPPGPMLDDYEDAVRNRIAFVAHSSGGEICGVLVMIESDASMLLDNIAVSPAWQGHRLGSRLMHLAEQLAAQRGWKLLELYTHELMTENIEMYRRMGYEEARRVQEKGYARVYMKKELSASIDSAEGSRVEFVDGTPRIAIERVGRGVPVMFLHGIGGNRSNWREALAATAGAGFCAVAWDARGYGDSDDYGGAMRFEDLSQDLLRLLRHLAVDDAHFVGLSMGGRIALDFYFRHPQCVRSLSLCDTTPGFDAFSEAEKRDYVERRSAPLVAGAEPADIADGVIDKLKGPNATAAIIERLRASVSALRKDSYLKAVAATVAQAEIGRLEDVSAPCQILVGDNDRLTTPTVAREMAARIPHAQLYVITGAGHLSNIDNPHDFNERVLTFLSAVEASHQPSSTRD